MTAFNMKTPCANCPFRSDVTPYLEPGRVREILADCVEGDASFHCHKTVTHDDDGDATTTGKELQCAGALIMAERLGRVPQMVRIAERLGMYRRDELDMAAPVYTSPFKMLQAYNKEWKKRHGKTDSKINH